MTTFLDVRTHVCIGAGKRERHVTQDAAARLTRDVSSETATRVAQMALSCPSGVLVPTNQHAPNLRESRRPSMQLDATSSVPRFSGKPRHPDSLLPQQRNVHSTVTLVASAATTPRKKFLFLIRLVRYVRVFTSAEADFISVPHQNNDLRCMKSGVWGLRPHRRPG
jgi:hypothetical protein